MVKCFLFESIALLVLHPVAGFCPTDKSHYSTHRRLITLYNKSPPGSSQDSLSTLSTKLLHAQTGDQNAEALLNSRLAIVRLERTYVADSTIEGGGRGLFASCDCQEGDLLTCYPGDALLLYCGSENCEIEDWKLRWGDHVEHHNRAETLPAEQKGYVLQATDTTGILGLPQLQENPSYLGQFCNDGALGIPSSSKELAPYVIESQSRANASHQDICNGSHMVTVAQKSIRKGEEIFVSYGPDYWMEQNNNSHFG